jgi:gliding motility-associated lipoprotein GldH
MSCGADVVYTEFKNMPVNGWEAKDVKNYNPIITDTLADYEIQLTVRHTDAYPYQNMWLFVTIEKDTNVIVGEYVKYGYGAVASFRVYIECDGKTYFVHAPAYARIVVDLEKGKTYEIEYFVNSRVIKEFKLIE